MYLKFRKSLLIGDFQVTLVKVIILQQIFMHIPNLNYIDLYLKFTCDDTISNQVISIRFVNAANIVWNFIKRYWYIKREWTCYWS